MFFREVIKDCETEYQQESLEKGDSWKTMNIIDLHRKQEEEWNEYLDAQQLGKKYQELIDHILVSLMMAERIRIKATADNSDFKTATPKLKHS